ncbi:hypothetical protein ACN27J_29935 [Solwaraspora sp. WMMB762]|uniref:hypothetical protein n=1 Tax=Solwaraspora sp. WMMB762 TaxID=3404120 RepID=UPI003B961EB7
MTGQVQDRVAGQRGQQARTGHLVTGPPVRRGWRQQPGQIRQIRAYRRQVGLPRSAGQLDLPAAAPEPVSDADRAASAQLARNSLPAVRASAQSWRKAR